MEHFREFDPVCFGVSREQQTNVLFLAQFFFNMFFYCVDLQHSMYKLRYERVSMGLMKGAHATGILFFGRDRIYYNDCGNRDQFGIDSELCSLSKEDCTRMDLSTAFHIMQVTYALSTALAVPTDWSPGPGQMDIESVHIDKESIIVVEPMDIESVHIDKESIIVVEPMDIESSQCHNYQWLWRCIIMEMVSLAIHEASIRVCLSTQFYLSIITTKYTNFIGASFLTEQEKRLKFFSNTCLETIYKSHHRDVQPTDSAFSAECIVYMGVLSNVGVALPGDSPPAWFENMLRVNLLEFFLTQVKVIEKVCDLLNFQILFNL